MRRRNRQPGQPTPLRHTVEAGTPDAYLWAPFGRSMLGGLASLAPFALLLVVGSMAWAPNDLGFADRVAHGVNALGIMLAMGGFTIAPVLGGLYCALWALMSRGLVHVLRREPRLMPHMALHAAGGAVLLLAVSMGALQLSLSRQGLDSIVDAPSFMTLLIGAPLVGAAGAALGVWAIRREITWYVTVVRPPLPNVFDFVEGKRDRGEFERL